MATEAGEYLAIAKATIDQGPVKADVATAWAAIGILEVLLEAQRPVTTMRNPDAEWGYDPAGGMEMGERSADPLRRAAALEKQLSTATLQRDDALTQIVELEDELERWKARTRELNVAADRLSARAQLAEQERDNAQQQVGNQAEMIRRQREEIRNLREELRSEAAGAEA